MLRDINDQYLFNSWVFFVVVVAVVVVVVVMVVCKCASILICWSGIIYCLWVFFFGVVTPFRLEITF